MTSDQFILLDKATQELEVLRHGSFLAIRQEPEFIIRLYQIDSFYVELFYHQVKKEPVCIRSFVNLAKLDFYLNDIDLAFISC